MAFRGEDSLNTVKEEQTYSGLYYSSYVVIGRIHSSKLKVFGVDIIRKVVESYLRLCAGVEHKLVAESILCLAEIVLIVLRNLSRLILQTLDHL